MKLKTYGLFILSILFAAVGHFKVSGSVQPNGIEVYTNTTVIENISNGVLVGGFVFFLGIGMLGISVYNFVKEHS